MGIGRVIGGTVAGLGLVGVGYAGLGLAGEDNTTRDEAGAIVEEGQLGAFRIRVGDCVSGEATGLVEALDGVPCDQPHDLEVYYAFNLPDGTFPGNAQVAEQADTGCYDAFAPFVGLGYEESIYGFTTLVPTPESWDQVDDREVLCLIGNYDGTPKTGSARNTAV